MSSFLFLAISICTEINKYNSSDVVSYQLALRHDRICDSVFCLKYSFVSYATLPNKNGVTRASKKSKIVVTVQFKIFLDTTFT